MMPCYVRNVNNNIVELYGDRESFRCRQRNRYPDGSRVKSLRFISYKMMLRECDKFNKRIYHGNEYKTISRL